MTKQTAGYLVDQLERAGTSSGGRTRPTPGPGWSASATGAAPCSGRPAPSSDASRASGRATSARSATAELRTMLAELREITDPWWEGPEA